jgi:hypothetical protein
MILYGDSISMETVSTFNWFLAQSGFRGVNRTFGATAPCDWFSRMRDDRYRFAPAAVVMQFSGASVLSCMKDRDVLPAYREDVRTATRIFMDAGVPVVWVSTPLVGYPGTSVVEINQIEQEAAAELGATYVDAAAAVLDHGQFTSTLPCLRHETSRLGCTDGRIRVRSPDGRHLCPSGRAVPCAVYSSGALRYGSAQANAALRRVGARRSR